MVRRRNQNVHSPVLLQLYEMYSQCSAHKLAFETTCVFICIGVCVAALTCWTIPDYQYALGQYSQHCTFLHSTHILHCICSAKCDTSAGMCTLQYYVVTIACLRQSTLHRNNSNLVINHSLGHHITGVIYRYSKMIPGYFVFSLLSGWFGLNGLT